MSLCEQEWPPPPPPSLATRETVSYCYRSTSTETTWSPCRGGYLGITNRGGKTVIIRSGLEMQQHLPHLGHLRHLLAVPLMFPTQPALSNRPDAQLTQALLTEGNAAQRCYRLTLMVLRARLVCITLLIPLLAHTIFISRSHTTCMSNPTSLTPSL